MSSSRSTLFGVQYLRGLAALAVVVFHAAQGAKWAHAGHRGVDVFFVISGFIMTYTTAAAPVRPLDVGAALSFLRRRVLRVVPMYWLALSFTVLISLGRYTPDLGLLLDYAFIPRLHPYYPTKYFPFLVPGWTLNFEMFFYALFALTLLLGRFHWLVCALCIAGLSVLGHTAPPAGALRFYTSSLTSTFALGILIARLHLAGAFVPPRALAACVMLGASCVLFSPHANSVLLDTSCAALSVYGALYAFPARPWKHAMLLGDASYALYLVHTQVVGFSYDWVLKPLGVPSLPAGGALSVLFCVCVSLPVAVLLHRRLEQPLGRYLARVVPGEKKRVLAHVPEAETRRAA